MGTLEIAHYQSGEDLLHLQRDLDTWERIALTRCDSKIFSDCLTTIKFVQALIQNKFDDSRQWEDYKIIVCKDIQATMLGVAVFSDGFFLHFLISHPMRLIEREENGSSRIKGVGSLLLLTLLQQALRENSTLTFLAKSSALPFYQKIFGPIDERDYNRIPLLKIWTATSFLRKKIGV